MPTSLPLLLCVHLMTVPITLGDHIHRRNNQRTRRFGDRGQATTEYALILLAAALVGLLVVAWATAGGGAARISRLFNRAIDSVIDRV
ncbi:MAG: hypothetical protein HRT86_07355 [Ilumatobacteraceae bacterium]|nr:hypothetical protein [Ilumatobacteraceae bacterium]